MRYWEGEEYMIPQFLGLIYTHVNQIAQSILVSNHIHIMGMVHSTSFLFVSMLYKNFQKETNHRNFIVRLIQCMSHEQAFQSHGFNIQREMISLEPLLQLTQEKRQAETLVPSLWRSYGDTITMVVKRFRLMPRLLKKNVNG